jgi:hypothetical protein
MKMHHPGSCTALVQLPALSADTVENSDRCVFERFMHHLRQVPNSRMEIKILSAIHFAADMEDCSDAHVAKILVDFGLRAPRLAFPDDFLRFADSALLRTGWEVGGPTKALLALKNHWDAIGEDKFAAFRGAFSLTENLAAFHSL